MSPNASRLRPVRFRPLAAECLERRCVLAGSVTATFIDGNLRLFGDSQNNAVEVQDVFGEVVVRGIDSTRINGQAEVVFSAGAAGLGEVRAVLGKGHDRLFLLDLTTAGNVQLGLGQVDTLFDAGSDQIVLDNVRVGGDLRVNAGGGADLVLLHDVAVLGRTELRGGSGSDHLVIVDSAIAELVLDAGSGNDEVTIDSSLIGSGANIRLGIGDDTLSIFGDSVLGSGAFINGNSGRDRLTLDDDALLIEFVSLLSLEIRLTVI